MADYEGQQYRLRAGAPMPIGNRRFVLHTFGAEVYSVGFYEATTRIPASDRFRGQGGDLISANFSRLADRTGSYFQGKEVRSPSFVDEDSIF